MKRLFNIFLLIISIFALFNYSTVYAEDLDIYSKYAILYNLDDDLILYEKEADTKTSVASLTKIMTCIVAIENIDDINSFVTLSSEVFTGLAEANASVAGFRWGETVTYKDLLMGALLPSGADATRALSINISGNEENFVKLMNDKVQELGLKNTHFDNTTGLESPTHYSTVKDISIILKYALENETFKEMYETREYTTTNGLHFSSTLKKISNNYTVDTGNIIGSKTGYTDEAGLCMASIAIYNNVNYLLVTAGADYRGNTPRQLLDATNIYDYFSKNYGYKNMINSNDFITEIDINYSNEKKYKIYAPNTITKFVKNDFELNDINYKYDGLTNISHKNKIGDKLGVVNIIYNGEIIDTLDIYLTEEIKFSLIAYLIQTKLVYPVIILFIIIILIGFKSFKRKNSK